VHRFLGDALLLAQHWPTLALRHYRVYLKERPTEARTLVNAAAALALTDDADSAIGMLRTAIGSDPEHGEARLMLAQFLFAQRDLEGARMHAQRAVQLLPSRPDAYELLGRIRAVDGRLDEAARYFRDALTLDPDFGAAQESLARLTALRASR
jgi:tetratricopeptide (TPR) repeat protein